MSRKTIAKFSAFVISLAALSAISSGCFTVSPSEPNSAANNRHGSAYGAPKITGKIRSKEITESSGLAVSGCQEGVLWTHNDSGNAPLLFAINSAGADRGTWTVAGAKSGDWEDIAEFKGKGECYLYIGDIGNNSRTRSEFTIYRVREPLAGEKKNAAETGAVESLKFTYPDFRHDAETLMVHPQTGDIYVVTKRISGAAGVYKIEPDFTGAGTQQAKKIADISVPAIPNGFITGGDISPDGKRVVLCDYFAAYEFVLPEGAAGFDDIWGEKPVMIELGEREQGEAISYSADGNSIFATSEKKNSPIIEVKRKL
jgi:hypothetical protein